MFYYLFDFDFGEILLLRLHRVPRAHVRAAAHHRAVSSSARSAAA